MTRLDNIRMREQYEALHRRIAEALMVCPSSERDFLAAYEAEVLDRWQRYSGCPVRSES